nr:hypothetical protein [Tanacetum cinerariifolium]
MALLSMRADKFWKKTGKKISIQGSDVAGLDKSKVECFNCHKMGHFTRECRAPRNGAGWDWSYMANEGEDHALVADAEAPTEFALMANTESKRSDKIKDRVGYSVVPPPAVDLYLSPKKDLSWTGLLEFADDIVTDYSRPSPTIESTSKEGQNKNSSTSEDVASPITPKPFVKFVKSKDFQSESPEFVLKKKACFNCGDFTHLANDCRKKVKRGQLVKTQYRAPLVPIVNKNKPPVNRKFSTGRKNFPTTACVSTASTNVPTASASVATISQDTTSAYIDSQSSGSKIKFKDIKQINEDDIEEIDIKWSMELLSMRADKSDKIKDRVGYSVVPPPAVDLNLSPKKDLSWTGLPEFADDIVTDYSRPSPTIESTPKEGQNKNSSTSEDVASPITPKPFVKFVNSKDFQSEMKTQYRAPLVPIVNKNKPPVNRKFSTGRKNFPTANRKFPTASRKFPTDSTKIHTADMGRKGKAVKSSAC